MDPPPSKKDEFQSGVPRFLKSGLSWGHPCKRRLGMVTFSVNPPSRKPVGGPSAEVRTGDSISVLAWWELGAT